MSLAIKIKRLNGNETAESEIAVPLEAIGAATTNVKANRSAIAIFVKDAFKLDASALEVTENEVVTRFAHATSATSIPASHIKVNIMSVAGGITTLLVSRKNNIAHVRKMYSRTPAASDISKPPSGAFDLAFNGEVVGEWKILQDHPIEDGDVLIVQLA